MCVAMEYAEGSFVLFGNDAAMFSDMHKDVYGSRPRGERVFNSVKELDIHFQYLDNQINADIEDQKWANEAGFNKIVSALDTMVKYGAKTKRIALMWLLQANNCQCSEYGIEQLFYEHGICAYHEYKEKLYKITGRFR